MQEGTRFQVLAPVVRARKGEYVDLFSSLQTQGFSRVRVDGTVHSLTEPPKLKKQEKHTIEVIVDRLTVKESAKRRLTDSVETALGLAGGLVVLEFVDLDEHDPHRERTYSEHLACVDDGLSFEALEPRSFSFNSPFGACPECTGIGTRKEVDPDLVIPDPEKSLAQGAVAPWASSMTNEYFLRLLSGLGSQLGFSMDTPWEKLPAKVQKAVLHGSPDQVHVRYKNRYGRERSYYAAFEGVMPFLERRHEDTDSDWARDKYEGYMRDVPCPVCHGTRLKPEILAVKLNGRSIAEVTNLSIGDASEWLNSLELGERERAIADRVLKEIQARLSFLVDVGLDYLSLDRPAATLAGGEAQRIRLATQIGSGLVGVLYVLDEPSIGLHQRDNTRLIETLIRLRDMGNTLIVVEHDEDTIKVADWIVDIGPGAGEHGGEIVVSGSLEDLMASERSLTGAYLSGRMADRDPEGAARADAGARAGRQGRPGAQPQGRRRHVPAGLPRGGHRRVRVGQVQPGQRHPLHDAGQPAEPRAHGPGPAPDGHRPRAPRQGRARRPVADRPHAAVEPGHLHRRLGPRPQAVRQHDRGEDARVPARPLLVQRQGRALRGVLRRRHAEDRDELPARRLRARARSARAPGSTGRPSRCTTRARRSPRSSTCRSRRAADFFAAIPAIARYLRTLTEVGLGYVRLGQPATTLSGGEAQRVKLASELQKRSNGRSIYVLDEPTTGLHFEDIRKLLLVLQGLVDKGNSVIVIEHNLDVIKSADWLIDMGPEGGFRGGTVVAEGPPEFLATVPESHTGRYLAKILDPDAVAKAAAPKKRVRKKANELITLFDEDG